MPRALSCALRCALPCVLPWVLPCALPWALPSALTWALPWALPWVLPWALSWALPWALPWTEQGAQLLCKFQLLVVWGQVTRSGQGSYYENMILRFWRRAMAWVFDLRKLNIQYLVNVRGSTIRISRISVIGDQRSDQFRDLSNASLCQWANIQIFIFR